MRLKKVLITTVACIMTVVVGVFGAMTVYGWLVGNGTEVNDFTIGDVDISIDEDFVPPVQLTTGDNVFKKAVRITNVSNVPCYVRARIDFSDSDVVKDMYMSYYALTSPSDSRWVKASSYTYTSTAHPGWEYISGNDDPDLEGWYYYADPLEPGESTDYLFRSVNARFSTAESVKDFEIFVSAEAVQTVNRDGQPFSSWYNAWAELIYQALYGAYQTFN